MSASFHRVDLAFAAFVVALFLIGAAASPAPAAKAPAQPAISAAIVADPHLNPQSKPPSPPQAAMGAEVRSHDLADH